MRDVLRKRVRQQVERLVEDMTELAVRRVEAELERMGEAFGVALSAFASEVTSADSDRRDHDPVPHVRRSARRRLHRDEPGGQGVADPSDVDRQDSRAAQASSPRRSEGERTARLVDPLADVLGPELAGMLSPAPVRRAPANKGQKTICRKCGYVGGNARGCGTAHPTRVTGDGVAEYGQGSSTVNDIAYVSKRIASVKPVVLTVTAKPSAATPDRRAAIAALATKQQAPQPQAVERDPDEPDRPDIFEDEEPLADRIARAEASKREGELPRPRSSFDLEHTGGKYADVRELDFGGEG